jgi:lipoprotein-anchoring transpeptidase ErfK/SrfK
MKRYFLFSLLLYSFSLTSVFANQEKLPETEMVYFPSNKPAGSIVVMTEDKRLYYLLGDDMAYEFPIAVGKREKDRFYGIYPISRKVKWPSWRPTPSMLKKEPNLPKVVKGGKKNPLGARALYLGDSPFRIHGTNRPSSIGKAASHGCIRMYNRDIKRLYNLVELWDTVYVQ